MTDRSLRDIGQDKSLVLVDDDEPFLRRLARAMEKRGFEVETATCVAAGRAIATARPPAYGVSRPMKFPDSRPSPSSDSWSVLTNSLVICERVWPAGKSSP